jgi:hypothetical protein
MVASVGSGDASKSNRHSEQEWIPVRGKKGGNPKKRFETKIGEDNSNLVYLPYNGRARVVFAGVAPHEKHACNHVPFPKSSNENGNRRFRKRKCVKKKPVQRQVKPTRQSATRVKNEWVKFEKLLSEFQPEFPSYSLEDWKPLTRNCNETASTSSAIWKVPRKHVRKSKNQSQLNAPFMTSFTKCT